MKCIICEQPNEFRFKEVVEPSFGPGEALVRIRRFGICGTDLHAFKGDQPFFSYPRVLGHELAGVIEEIGPNSYGFSPGDIVSIIPYLECGRCPACRSGKPNCCDNLKVLGVHVDGGMQELLAVPVDHLIKTDGLTFDQAVILEPLSIGAHGVRRASMQKNEPVLVIGAGPIGLSVIAFAALQEAKVIVMDVNEERLNFSRRWAKVEATINALDNPLEELKEITGGNYPRVVFDVTGNSKSMNSSFNFVGNGGKLIFVGLTRENITFSDPDFHSKELTLLSSRNALKEDFEVVKRAILSREINWESYITHRTGFNGMVEQFETLFDPRQGVIKAIIEV